MFWPRMGFTPALGDADVAGDHAEVGEVHDVGGADGVLGDAERVEDAGLARRRVELRRRDDRLGRHPGDLRGALRRVVLDGRPRDRRSPRCARRCTPWSCQPLLMIVCSMPLTSALSVPGLSRSQRCACSASSVRRGSTTMSLAPRRCGLLHLVADDRVRLGGVGPDDEQHVVADDLADRVGHRA